MRFLDPQDEDQWRVLWDGYCAFYGVTVPAEVTDTTWRRLLDENEPHTGIVAVNGAQLFGFVHVLVHRSTWSIGDYGYLEDLFVDPQARGQGIGRALIKRVFQFADERGLTRIYWVTKADNPARRLYDQVAEESGFVQYRHTP